ncbi:hypothetical protein IT401_01405 [Candidatus Nomurabacteria bacterium]|nr:hypothetical protein [Candidatus Nomurabacteria bacterium]
MKKLESFLGDGMIRIGYSGCCLSAVFLPYDRKCLPLQVFSDKGIPHLFLLLEASLQIEESCRKHLLEEAQQRYPHSLGVFRNDVDHFVCHRLITISASEEGVRLSCLQLTAPSIVQIPDAYHATVCAATLEKAMQLIMKASFKKNTADIE